MKKRYGLALLPALLGLIVANLWQQGLWPNPILYLRADAGSLIWMLGVAVSIVWTAGWAT
jgi:hypothetical protein